MRTLVFIVICYLFLPACTVNDTQNSESKAQPEDTETCVYIGEVGEWEAFDPNNLYVEDASDGSHYLISMGTMCLGMQGHVKIGFPYKKGRICQGGGERLSYRRYNLSRTCPTDGWQAVKSREDARDAYEAADNQ